jgi:hypothetical protein
MQPSVLSVVRDGDRWGVVADGDLMALARTKRDAQQLARSAVQILRESGGEARVEVPREPRSFKTDD